MIYSNGMLLTQDVAHKLKELSKDVTIDLLISVDGPSPEATERWRKNSNYKTIKDNLTYAIKYMGSQRDVRFTLRGACVLPSDLRNKSLSTIKQYLSTAGNYLRQDFPGANVTVKFAYPDIEVQGTEVMSVECENLSYCRNIFEIIFVEADGGILDCTCSTVYRIIGNVLEEDMYDVWRKSPLLSKSRKMFRGAEIPHMCELCVANPYSSRQKFLIKSIK